MKLSFVIGVITLISVVSVAFAEDGVAEETTVPSTSVQADEQQQQQPDQYTPPAKSGAFNVDWEKMDSFLVSHPLAIVVVYSPSCPACHNYMPQFDAAVEQYKAELDPKADSGLEFVRVDGVDGSTDWTVDHGITSFPTVRLFANGAFVKKNLHENARTTPEILSMFQRMNTRMLSRTAPSVALEQDLDKIFNQVVMEERRTLILAQFASEEAPPGADPGETASPCRLAFAAGMAELVDLDYFTVHTTRIDGVSKAARAKIEVDIALKGFTGAHPDQGAVCSIYSLMTILRCSGVNNTAPCKVLGASIPIPSSTDELVRAVLVHGVPEGVQLVPATSSLISRIWLDRSVPQTSRGLTQYTRVGRRTRPTLVYFSELKACEEDTPEFKWARYIKRTMRSIAVDYPNMTLMVADQYEFNTLYLRLGFNRQDSRDGIVMGIFDEGLRFSSVSLNFTKFKPEIIREFINAFNQGRIAPHITEVKYSKKTEGKKVTNQMSSLGFFNTLWRTNEPIPDPRPVGGIEDVILVVFAHKHCMRCREIIAQYELLIDARNRRLERVGKANQASSQFLTMTAKDRAEAATKPGYVDLEEIVNGATVDANRKGLVLERLVPIFVNATDNYPPTEIWQPVLTSNLRPIIGTCVRVSQIAFDEARKPQWEVTAHAPGFMDFMSTRFAHSAPTALHLLDLAVSEWERHESFGLKVVRMEK